MALDAIPEPMGSRILRSIGLQPKSKSRRTPELVLARIASMPARQLHFLTWVLVAVPLESLADPADGQEQEQEEAQEAAADEVSVADLLRGGGLARGAQRWPRSILALGVEGLWDQDLLTVEDRDELLAVLAGPDLPSVSTAPVPDRQGSAAESDASPVGTDRVASAGPSAGPELPQPDLRRLLGRAVDVALAPTASAAEVGRQVAGLEWLIDLDPVEPDVWFHYGRLLAHRDSPPARTPRGHDPRQQLVEGQFQGLVERGDHDRIVHFAGQHPEVVERVLAGEDPGEVHAGLLEAHVGVPRELARLLVMVRRPFRGWQRFARRSRAEAAKLLAQRQGSEAEILLSALEDRLMRWAAIDGAQAARCRAEGLATMVLRASCRRRRSDFAGAIHLLRDVDTEILDRAARDAADVEWAMAKADFSGIEQLTFPSDSSRLQDRLEAARPHLDRVLQSDPAHLEANLLAGVLGYCRQDDGGVARHLGILRDRLSGIPEWSSLAWAVAFHRACARLRQLDVGTDERAYREMVEAIDHGYVPPDSELLSAAVALEAHDSPYAGDFLARAVDLAGSTLLMGLVLERARSGDVRAAALAETSAGEHQRRAAERYELLDAALAGAEHRADAAAADRLAGLLDDVVARANQPELDSRWAHTLATGQTLRAVLDPAHADAIRLEVLRRAGRLDEARGIATALFYRAAAGSLAFFDAGELLEVLRELGLAPAELDELSRLLHDEPLAPQDQPPPLPTRILFVGGTQAQERYRVHLDAEIRERYAGRVTVEWYFSGWNSNWPKTAEAIQESYRLRDPHAVVLMTFVRTNFGRWVRRTSGEHGLPWISCAGHGRASMASAIDRAVRVVADRTQGGASDAANGLK